MDAPRRQHLLRLSDVTSTLTCAATSTDRHQAAAGHHGIHQDPATGEPSACMHMSVNQTRHMHAWEKKSRSITRSRVYVSDAIRLRQLSATTRAKCMTAPPAAYSTPSRTSRHIDSLDVNYRIQRNNYIKLYDSPRPTTSYFYVDHLREAHASSTRQAGVERDAIFIDFSGKTRHRHIVAKRDAFKR